MEISKNPEREELERSVQMFMFGVEKRVRSGYKIALFEHTQYDKENDKHVFVGLELRLIADDYSGGNCVEICNVNMLDRIRYYVDGEYYDRADIEKMIIDKVYKLLGEYAEYAKNKEM